MPNPSAQDVAALLEATALWQQLPCKTCGVPVYILIHRRGPLTEGDPFRLIKHTADGRVHLNCSREKTAVLREHAAHG